MTDPCGSISAAPGNAYHDDERAAEAALVDALAIRETVALAQWQPVLAEHFIAAGTPARAVLRLLVGVVERIQ